VRCRASAHAQVMSAQLACLQGQRPYSPAERTHRARRRAGELAAQALAGPRSGLRVQPWAGGALAGRIGCRLSDLRTVFAPAGLPAGRDLPAGPGAPAAAAALLPPARAAAADVERALGDSSLGAQRALGAGLLATGALRAIARQAQQPGGPPATRQEGSAAAGQPRADLRLVTGAAQAAVAAPALRTPPAPRASTGRAPPAAPAPQATQAALAGPARRAGAGCAPARPRGDTEACRGYGLGGSGGLPTAGQAPDLPPLVPGAEGADEAEDEHSRAVAELDALLQLDDLAAAAAARRSAAPVGRAGAERRAQAPAPAGRTSNELEDWALFCDAPLHAAEPRAADAAPGAAAGDAAGDERAQRSGCGPRVRFDLGGRERELAEGAEPSASGYSSAVCASSGDEALQGVPHGDGSSGLGDGPSLSKVCAPPCAALAMGRERTASCCVRQLSLIRLLSVRPSTTRPCLTTSACAHSCPVVDASSARVSASRSATHDLLFMQAEPGVTAAPRGAAPGARQPGLLSLDRLPPRRRPRGMPAQASAVPPHAPPNAAASQEPGGAARAPRAPDGLHGSSPSARPRRRAPPGDAPASWWQASPAPERSPPAPPSTGAPAAAAVAGRARRPQAAPLNSLLEVWRLAGGLDEPAAPGDAAAGGAADGPGDSSAGRPGHSGAHARGAEGRARREAEAGAGGEACGAAAGALAGGQALLRARFVGLDAGVADALLRARPPALRGPCCSGSGAAAGQLQVCALRLCGVAVCCVTGAGGQGVWLRHCQLHFGRACMRVRRQWYKRCPTRPFACVLACASRGQRALVVTCYVSRRPICSPARPYSTCIPSRCGLWLTCAAARCRAQQCGGDVAQAAAFLEQCVPLAPDAGGGESSSGGEALSPPRARSREAPPPPPPQLLPSPTASLTPTKSPTPGARARHPARVNRRATWRFAACACAAASGMLGWAVSYRAHPCHTCGWQSVHRIAACACVPAWALGCCVCHARMQCAGDGAGRLQKPVSFCT